MAVENEKPSMLKDAERKAVPERRCPACGKTFCVESEKNRRKYCNDECRTNQYKAKKRKIESVEKQCPVCGIIFQCGQNAGVQKYCSDTCRGKNYRSMHAKEKREDSRECPVCGVDFKVSGRAVGRRKYCSNVCRDKYYRDQSTSDVNLTEAQLRGEKCINCDAEISQASGVKQKLYCSRKCERQFSYRTSPEQRAALRQQLYKTKEPTGRLQSCRQIYVCKCCGKEFEGYNYRQRVYCSRECNNKSHSYAGSEKQALAEEIRLSPSSATHRAAMEMYAGGICDSEISKVLDCSISTVQGWLRTYKKRLEAPPKHRPFSEPYYRYIHARSAAEWIAVLNDEMRCNSAYNDTQVSQEKTVTLICGTVYTRTNLYALVEIVRFLEIDPLDGGLYAFCGTRREHLICLHWDGGSFQLTKRRRDYGRYVWPSEKLGKTIELTASEFEFIRLGSIKNNRENP